MADVDVSLVPSQSVSDSDSIKTTDVPKSPSPPALLSDASDVDDFNDYSSFSDSDTCLSEDCDLPVSLVNPTKLEGECQGGGMRRISSIGLLTSTTPSSNNCFDVSDTSAACSTPTEEYQTSDRSATSSPEDMTPRHFSADPTAEYTPNRTVAQTCYCDLGARDLGARDLGSCDTITSTSHDPDVRSSSRLSYVSRALAMARPTSPPPPYNTASADATPTVLALRSYFGFTPVSRRPHSAPNHRLIESTPSFSPNDMSNEPYTLQAIHIIQHVPIRESASVPINAVAYYRLSNSDRTPEVSSNSSAVSLPVMNTSVREMRGTPPVAYQTRLQSRAPNEGQYLRVTELSAPSSSAPVTPPLIIDTSIVTEEDCTSPPPYTAGDYVSVLRAPRYSEIVNPHFFRHSSLFGRHSAFSCMGSVRTLAIGITLCCCGIVFLMVTYVFGAVENTYLGYLGIMQVFIGMSMIFLVALYNSGRCFVLDAFKRLRCAFCPRSYPPQPV